MADEFSVDPSSITAATKALNEMSTRAGAVKTQLTGLARSLGDLQNFSASSLFGDAAKSSREVAKNARDTAKSRADEAESLKKSTGLLKQTRTQLERVANTARNYGRSMTGIQFSLVGILGLMIELSNRSRRVGAMGRQMAAQWKSGKGNIKEAVRTMGLLRGQYRMSIDEAGNLATSIARVGVEKEHVREITNDLVAAEYMHGISAQEGARQMVDLSNAYGVTQEHAQDLLTIVRETTKDIPGLSMGEASSDMMDLVQLTKTYNTDLLGTLGLYNSLIRTSAAEELGLGNVAKGVRKDIAMTVAGFSQNLGEGWKAALGEGATLAERMISFENLDPTEQFARMAGKINEMTQQFTDPFEKEFATRKLLGEVGFSGDAATELARTFADQGFDVDTFADALRKRSDEAKDQAQTVEQVQKQLSKQAQSIAQALESWQAKLKRSIMQGLEGSEGWQKISSSVNELLSVGLPKIVEFLTTGFSALVSAIETLVDLVRDIHDFLTLPDPSKESTEKINAQQKTLNEMQKVALTKVQSSGLSKQEQSDLFAARGEITYEQAAAIKRTTGIGEMIPSLGAQSGAQLRQGLFNVALSTMTQAEMQALLAAEKADDQQKVYTMIWKEISEFTKMRKQNLGLKKGGPSAAKPTPATVGG